MERNGVRAGDLAAVASTGGGARIPLVTTTLSEHFRVPVITAPHPELAAAIGGGLSAPRAGTVDEGATVDGAAAAAAAAAAAIGAAQIGAGGRTRTTSTRARRRALAWSDADDVPDVVAVTDPYDYDPVRRRRRPPTRWRRRARRSQFEPETGEHEAVAQPTPWYRRR